MRPTGLSVFLAFSAVAQNPPSPAFEVASVKINRQYRQEDRATWRPSIRTSPGSLTFRNVNLTMIVAWAYHLQWPQIVGADAADPQRYDILAKATQPANTTEMRTMLQTLLVERFGLVSHRETRQMEVLMLVEPKGGHKMVQSKIDAETQSRQDPNGRIAVEGVPLMEFAGDMARELSVPILDTTGLKGRFNFTFDVQKYVAALKSQVRADPEHAPGEDELRLILMQEAVAGELGLRLMPRRAPVEVLVIDHVEKSPTEN